MTQKKPPPAPPAKVEVIRKPASEGAPKPTPRAPGPTPTPTPRAPAPTPTPTPRPAGPPSGAPEGPARTYAPASRPPPRPGFGGGPRGPGGPPGKSFPRHRPPAHPPTPQEIVALAQRERVPARIAKGELEGKMKARIWRKLHAEEARRFDQAYAVMEKHPELDLADAFGVVQSGRSVAEFLAKKARGKLKQDIKEARGALPGDAVEQWLQARVASGEELATVMADRTIIDKLTALHPVALTFERAGRIEKLQVVAMAHKDEWEKRAATLERDAKLARKPVAVQRQPDRRPVADPRAFLPFVGKRVRLELRNGILILDTLLAVGPYDVLVGAEGAEVFVPLHAMLRWSDGDAPAPPPASDAQRPEP